MPSDSIDRKVCDNPRDVSDVDIGPTKRMGVDLSPTYRMKLKFIAKKEGITISELIRQWIDSAFEKTRRIHGDTISEHQ